MLHKKDSEVWIEKEEVCDDKVSSANPQRKEANIIAKSGITAGTDVPIRSALRNLPQLYQYQGSPLLDSSKFANELTNCLLSHRMPEVRSE